MVKCLTWVVILFLLLSIVGFGCASISERTFQEVGGTPLTQMGISWWKKGGQGVEGDTPGAITLTATGHASNYALYAYGSVGIAPNTVYALSYMRVRDYCFGSPYNQPITYYAFVAPPNTIYCKGTTGNDHPCSAAVYFMSAVGASVANSGDFASYLQTYDNYDLFEFYRYGTSVYTYVNGTLVQTMGGFSSESYYVMVDVGVTAWGYSAVYCYPFQMDNIQYGSPAGRGVIATMPETWYAYKDFSDSANDAIYENSSMKNSSYFATVYQVASNMEEYTTGATITTTHTTTGIVVNTTAFTQSQLDENPSNIILYNARDMLFNTSAPSGMYAQTLRYGDEVIDTTYFMYMSGGGSVFWDEDLYNIGDFANVTTNVGASFNLLEYDYQCRIYSSSGEMVDSWTITTESHVESVEITSDTFENGFYYAELFAVRKSDSYEFLIGYDIAEVIESLIVNGYTWDAINATKLGNVSVGSYQLYSWSNTTSNITSAFYEILDLVSNAEIMFNASKVGYNHSPIYITPLESKRYDIDLYLIQTPLPFNGSAICGLVLNSHYKQAVDNATVTLSNATWSGTRTSSTTGWYMFDSTSIETTGSETLATEVIDSTYDMGKYSSLTHNGTMLHVAYYDDTNNELIGAYKNGVWTPSVVDNGTVTTYDNFVYVADTGNHRVVQRDQDLIYVNKIGSEGTGDDNFNSTVGITTLRNYTVLSNYLYIADTNNNRIERRFANNLTFVDAFGTSGTGDDNFSAPQDVCVDGNGVYMWVADTGNHRIVQRFAENYTYVAQYGTYGTGTTNFSSPQGIGTESTGTYLLVTDSGNHRIMKFFAQNLTYIDSVGSVGTNNNQFNTPRSATIERSGADVFYVADTGNNRIMARKLSDLSYIRKMGSLGTGVDQFSAPKDVTTDGVYIYVADSGNNRIHKRYASDLSYVSMIGSSGAGDDQFSNPSGITVSLNGSATVDYNVGEYISSTADDSGNEWISYYDSSNSDLMVAYKSYDGVWHTIRVDSTADVGQYTGIAEYFDVFRVSYYNVTGQTLKYAYGNESGYTVETADATAGMGKYSSIAMTGGGEPRISCYYETSGDLMYVYKDMMGWHNTTIDSTDNVGQYTDIVIDGSGYAYISYYDVTNANLKYAHRNSTGWYTETVDSTGDVGKYTSITRSETTGYVYISYYDTTNGNLKMAYHNTTAWNIATIDSSGNVGEYTSIDVDSDGYPHISYYDVTNQQLKHTYYYLSTTTSSDLAPLTSYNITSSKESYVTNTSTITSPSYGNYTLYTILMQQYFTLTVNIKDITTNTPITSGIDVTLSDGQSHNTTTGQAQFQALYGSYTVTATGTDYYTGTATTILDIDKEVTIYLTEKPDYSSTIDYTIAPRNVRFICVDHFGQRLKNVEVSAVGYDTTLPDWGILNVVFGWMSSYTNASMSNDTMSGTTGDDGSVVFLMTESLQYMMDFNETTRGIHESLTLYPKDDTYVITLGTSPFAEPSVQYINISLYTSEPNSSATTLWASYNDPNLHTTSANFTVRNASGYVLYSHVTGGSSSFTDSYTVSHVTGTQYTWGIAAVQTDYGNISRYTSTTLHSRLIELGLEDMYYNWISLIFLFILIGLFSGRSVIYGYVVFPLVMGIFYFIGWLQITYVLASGVIILGIMLFLSKRQFQGEGI